MYLFSFLISIKLFFNYNINHAKTKFFTDFDFDIYRNDIHKKRMFKHHIKYIFTYVLIIYTDKYVVSKQVIYF